MRQEKNKSRRQSLSKRKLNGRQLLLKGKPLTRQNLKKPIKRVEIRTHQRSDCQREWRIFSTGFVPNHPFLKLARISLPIRQRFINKSRTQWPILFLQRLSNTALLLLAIHLAELWLIFMGTNFSKCMEMFLVSQNSHSNI